METVSLAAAGAVVGILAALSGVVLGWLGNMRSGRRAVAEKTAADVQLRTDVEYIKRGVDDIRADVRRQGLRVDELSDRMARVEESAKSAHRRIDEIIGKEK